MFLIFISLGSNKVFAIKDTVENTKIVWLDGLIWSTAYEDAYKIYKGNSEQKLDILIKDLENKLKRIVIKYKENQNIPKYQTQFRNDNDVWGVAIIKKWGLQQGMGLGWEYHPSIYGQWVTADNSRDSNSVQSNKIPVEFNKMLKAFYITAMQKQLEYDKKELENNIK